MDGRWCDPYTLDQLPLVRDRPFYANHLGEPSAYWLRSVNHMFDQLYEEIMAKMTSRNASKRPDWQVDFIEVRLDKEEVKAFNVYAKRPQEELSLDLATTISNKNKLSVSWDEKNVCFVASCTCRDIDSANENCCISSRSDDWWEAICLTMFKINVVLGDKAWREGQSSASWG